MAEINRNYWISIVFSTCLALSACNIPAASAPESSAPETGSGMIPPAGVTVVPEVGDLGWGAVHGQVIDAVSGQPMEGVKVECLHSSIRDEYSCEGVTLTDADGRYTFTPVYFNQREYISLIFEAPGYVPQRLAKGPFVQAGVPADVGLFPESYPTEVPPVLVMCSPPPCENGQLACGIAEGCPGGCGTVCVQFSPTP